MNHDHHQARFVPTAVSRHHDGTAERQGDSRDGPLTYPGPLAEFPASAGDVAFPKTPTPPTPPTLDRTGAEPNRAASQHPGRPAQVSLPAAPVRDVGIRTRRSALRA